MQYTTAFTALLMIPAFGCIDEELVDEPEVEVTTQALAGTEMTYHECDQAFGLPCFVDLGSSANNRACFIGGIYGHLEGGSVLIYNDGTNYNLMLAAPSGEKIAAKTTCISGGTNRATMTWTAGQAYDTEPATPWRRCFLQSISSVDDVAFNDTTDYMHVWKSGSTWYLGGQISGGAQPWASAVCVDTPWTTGAWGGVAPLLPNVNYSISGDLVDNESGGWVCGLAKLGGKFMSSSFTDKIAIGYNATSKTWNWQLVNGKQAEAYCVK
jgi:hypothetical protein